jgi:hypothetical protein
MHPRSRHYQDVSSSCLCTHLVKLLLQECTQEHQPVLQSERPKQRYRVRDFVHWRLQCRQACRQIPPSTHLLRRLARTRKFGVIALLSVLWRVRIVLFVRHSAAMVSYRLECRTSSVFCSKLLLSLSMKLSSHAAKQKPRARHARQAMRMNAYLLRDWQGQLVLLFPRQRKTRRK